MKGLTQQDFILNLVKKIWACDFDRKAIKEAKKKYSIPNVIFEVADIRTDIPER